MPRKAQPGLKQFNIRMPSDLLDALDRLVDEHTKANPGAMFTRSDLIRVALYDFIERRKRAK